MQYLPMHVALPTLLALAGALTPGIAQDKAKPVSGTLPIEASEKLNWRSVGPANMGGRITDIAVHPTDGCVYWIGTAGGGVLKTVNNGVTYEHQFTSENVASIGAVAVSTSNLAVAQGERGGRQYRDQRNRGGGPARRLSRR